MFETKIFFRDFEKSEALESVILEKSEKLVRYNANIQKCDVTIFSTNHQKNLKEKIYHVQIHVKLPFSDLIVNREPEKNEAHKDIYVAIRDAFKSMERQLKESTRIVRGETKRHQSQAV